MTTPGTLAGTLSHWAAGLRQADVPARVRSLAASQVLSQLAAIRAGRAHPLGVRLERAFGSPLQDDPRGGAAVLAALGSWLNLDDTAYAGHLGPATVGVPLAYALALGLDGAALVTAVVAADECAARVSAAATLGPFRGQSALHTPLAGGVAGRLHASGAGAESWVAAFGLAFTLPIWPVMHGFLGSDAKTLHTLAPVRLAMDACDAAAAGLRGPADILEHPRGFLRRFATVPLPEEITAGLGERWHTDTLSFKVRPGGPGIDAAVDCAIALHRDLTAAGYRAEHDIAEVTVEASLYTTFVGRAAHDYLDGAATPISALLLATPYAVASTLLTGDLTVADFAEPAVGEAARWSLATRVHLTEDPAMTEALLGSTAPFGAAVGKAGQRAVSWLADLGGSALVKLAASCTAVDDYREATKRTPARVRVRLTDGRTLTRERDIPVGAAGPDTRRTHAALVRTKFLESGGAPEVADALGALDECSPADLRRLLPRALAR